MAHRRRPSAQPVSEDEEGLLSSRSIPSLLEPRRNPPRRSVQASMSPTRTNTAVATKGHRRNHSLPSASKITSKQQRELSRFSVSRMEFSAQDAIVEEHTSERTIKATSVRVDQRRDSVARSPEREAMYASSSKRGTAADLHTSRLQGDIRTSAPPRISSEAPFVGNLHDNRNRRAARRGGGHPNPAARQSASDPAPAPARQSIHMRKSLLPYDASSNGSNTRTLYPLLTAQERVGWMKRFAEHAIASVFREAAVGGDDEEMEGLESQGVDVKKAIWSDLNAAKKAIFDLKDVHPFIYMDKIHLPLGVPLDKLKAEIPELAPAVDAANLASFLRVICDPDEAASNLLADSTITTSQDTLARMLLEYAFKSFLGICLTRNSWDTPPAIISLIDLATQIYIRGSGSAGMSLDALFSRSAVDRLEHWEEASSGFRDPTVIAIKERASLEWQDLAREQARILSGMSREEARQRYPYDSFRREMIALISAMQPQPEIGNTIGNAIYARTKSLPGFASEQYSGTSDSAGSDAEDEGDVDDILPDRSRSGEARVAPDARGGDAPPIDGYHVDSGTEDESSAKGSGYADEEGGDASSSHASRENEDGQSSAASQSEGSLFADPPGLGASGHQLRPRYNLSDDGESQPDDGEGHVWSRQEVEDFIVEVTGRPTSAQSGIASASASEQRSSYEREDDEGTSWQVNKFDGPDRRPDEILRRHPRQGNTVAQLSHDFAKPQADAAQIQWDDNENPSSQTPRQPPRLASVKKSTVQREPIKDGRSEMQPELSGLLDGGQEEPITPGRLKAWVPESVRKLGSRIFRTATPQLNGSARKGKEREGVQDEQSAGSEGQTEAGMSDGERSHGTGGGDDLVMDDGDQPGEPLASGSESNSRQPSAAPSGQARITSSTAARMPSQSRSLAAGPSSVARTPSTVGRKSRASPSGGRTLPVKLSHRPDVPTARAPRGQKRRIEDDEEVDELQSEPASPAPFAKRPRGRIGSVARRAGPIAVTRRMDDRFMVDEHGQVMHDEDGKPLLIDEDIPLFVPPWSDPNTQKRGTKGAAKKGSRYRVLEGNRRWTPEETLKLYRLIQVMPVYCQSAYHKIALHMLGDPSRTSEHEPVIPGRNLQQLKDKMRTQVAGRTARGEPVVGNARSYLDSEDPRKGQYLDNQFLAKQDHFAAMGLKREESSDEDLVEEEQGDNGTVHVTDGAESEGQPDGTEEDESENQDDDIESEDGAPAPQKARSQVREARARTGNKSSEADSVGNRKSQPARSRSVSVSEEIHVPREVSVSVSGTDEEHEEEIPVTTRTRAGKGRAMARTGAASTDAGGAGRRTRSRKG